MSTHTPRPRGPLGYPLFDYHLGRTVQWGHWGITFMDRQPDEQLNFGIAVGTLPFAVGACGPVDGTVGSETRLHLQAACDAWVRDCQLPAGIVRPGVRWPDFTDPTSREAIAAAKLDAALTSAYAEGRKDEREEAESNAARNIIAYKFQAPNGSYWYIKADDRRTIDYWAPRRKLIPLTDDEARITADGAVEDGSAA